MKLTKSLAFIAIIILGSGDALAQERIDREHFFKSCESVIEKKEIFYHKTKNGTEKHWLRANPVLKNPGRKTIQGIFDFSESHWAKIDNRKLARIAKLAGAPKSPGAGIVFYAPLHKKVSKGDVLYSIYAEGKGQLEYVKEYLKSVNHLIVIE